MKMIPTWMLGSLGLILLALLAGCSSTTDDRIPEDREHERLQRDFIVRDASSRYRPGWIEDAEIWAREHGYDNEKNRYFSFETEPKVSRSISCSLAKANATASVAREISTFISQSLSSTTSGDASIDQNHPQMQRLNRYVRRDLQEKVQNMVYGAKVLKTYWEKRKYKKEKGANRDFTAWTCAVFVEMDGEKLKEAIEKASEDVANQVEDPGLKEKVQKTLQKAPEQFHRL